MLAGRGGPASGLRASVRTHRRLEPVLVDRLDDGVAVGLTRDVRIRTEVTVRVRRPTDLPGKPWRERTVGGRVIRYAVDRFEDGGSCGGADELLAWEPCGDRVVTWAQVRYDECGGSLEFAWLVIAATRCGVTPAPG